MDKRLIITLSGISISIIGFVYALSNQHKDFSEGLNHIQQGNIPWVYIFTILPNLLPSIPIIIGGIIIIIIGITYFKEQH